MHELYTAFRDKLDNEDRQGCLDLCHGWLTDGHINIVALYEDVLTPALREEINHSTGRPISIWEEHVRSSIVRTAVECCYRYVAKERVDRAAAASGEKVIIFCPIEEYHEIGARMVMDFFILCGFDAVFIGANTPRKDILLAVEAVRPACVAASVSNYYNLVAARKTLDGIRALRERLKLNFTLAVGGIVFTGHPERFREVGADLLLQTYADVERFARDLK
jgi:methanogenic corrinoid protein MtbC1